MTFEVWVLLIAVVGCIVGSIFKGNLDYYRSQHEGRYAAFLWGSVKTLFWIALFVGAVLVICSSAPAYFWWILVAGYLLIQMARLAQAD